MSRVHHVAADTRADIAARRDHEAMAERRAMDWKSEYKHSSVEERHAMDLEKVASRAYKHEDSRGPLSANERERRRNTERYERRAKQLWDGLVRFNQLIDDEAVGEGSRRKVEKEYNEARADANKSALEAVLEQPPGTAGGQQVRYAPPWGFAMLPTRLDRNGKDVLFIPGDAQPGRGKEGTTDIRKPTVKLMKTEAPDSKTPYEKTWRHRLKRGLQKQEPTKFARTPYSRLYQSHPITDWDSKFKSTSPLSSRATMLWERGKNGTCAPMNKDIDATRVAQGFEGEYSVYPTREDCQNDIAAEGGIPSWKVTTAVSEKRRSFSMCKFKPPCKHMSARRKVPYFVHQTHETASDVDRSSVCCASRKSWRSYLDRISKGTGQYVLWSATDRDHFMKLEHPDIYDIWRILPLNVMKVDVWRYAVLHRYGGIYADIDLTVKDNAPDLFSEDGLVCGTENSEHYCNWLLSAPEGCSLVLHILDHLKGSLRKASPVTPLSFAHNEHLVHTLTGPGAFTKAIRDWLTTHSVAAGEHLPSSGAKHPGLLVLPSVAVRGGFAQHHFIGGDQGGWLELRDRLVTEGALELQKEHAAKERAEKDPSREGTSRERTSRERTS